MAFVWDTLDGFFDTLRLNYSSRLEEERAKQFWIDWGHFVMKGTKCQSFSTIALPQKSIAL